MRGFLVAIPLSVFPTLAIAGANDVSVAILSPAGGGCVNNGGELFSGGVLGGLAAQPIGPVSVNLRLTDGNGNGAADPITVRLSVDGQVVSEHYFQAAAEGQPFETGPIPVFTIEDGENVTLEAEAINGASTARQSVTFDLDREAPSVTADGNLPDPIVCAANPPAVPYTVADDFDAAPDVEERFEFDGCNVRRIVRVADACGNAQEVSASSRRPPPDPNAISVSFGGVAEGARVATAALTYDIQAPVGCVDSIQSSVTRDGEGIGPVIYGEELAVAGNYDAQISVSSCGGQPATARRRFTVLAKPIAEAGGPYQSVQNQAVRLCATDSQAPAELGGIVGYAWDINNDGYFDEYEGRTACIDFGADKNDGEYTVRVQVRAGNGTQAEDTATVTITDVTPTCGLVVPPGPFDEGELVDFDATGSRPGNEFEDILLYEWRFGDGSPDQLAAGLGTTLHRYDAPGTFTYSVTVHDIDSSCTTSGELVIRDVAPICEAVNALGADDLYEGMPVQFTVEAAPGSFSDPITGYTWYYGDSPLPDNGAFNFAPTHVYQDQGTFDIRVLIDDPDSQTECPGTQVVVQDLAPVAELDGPRVVTEGEAVTFDALQTRAGGPADPLTVINWDFGDGQPSVDADPNERRQVHTFVDDGEFDVILTATDEDSEATATLRVRVLDVAPVADFTVVYAPERESADEGVEIELDATASAPGAAEDPIAEYRWDFGDGETAEGPDLDVVRHAFPDDGTYLVRLTVVDEDGSVSTTERTVGVENVAPVVRIEVEEDQLDVNVPHTFTAVVEDVDADFPRVDWDMGDDESYENALSVTHTYRVQGRRVITVSVTDGDGGVATAEVAVEVTRGRPRFVVERVYRGREGDALSFEFQVLAAESDPGVFDGPVQVPVPQLPPGAEWSERPGVPAEASKTIRLAFTPTYVDAGRITLLLRAVAPSGLTRDTEVTVEIEDAGTPYAAAVATVNGEGRVTVLEYGRDPLSHALGLRPTAEIPVGAGIGTVAASDDGRWLFVASPASGGVAVIRLGDGAPHFARFIRTGSECTAVTAGDGRVYAVNAGDATLSIIDAETLKVIRTVNLGQIGRPMDAVYLPAGFDGLEDAHIAVVGARGGHIALLDAAAAEAGRGDAAISASRRLGGVLQRVVADAETGWVHVADAKTRRLYAFQASEFLLDADGAELTGTALTFPPQDLAARAGTVWVASTGGLIELGGVAPPVVHARETSRTVEAVGPAIFPGGGVLLLGNQGLEHRNADLELVLQTSGRPSTRRLTTFVTLH
ncbi:PKD domain-containing protein [Myxococcota bacterium]|nr:PKD domain-containing protein [Myxococcota bacterium]